MNKIDTTLWSEFKIMDLFETSKKGNKIQVPTGASVSPKDLIKDGTIPRITVTNTNNGVTGMFDYDGHKPSDYRIFNNFISVSFLGTVFYHKGNATLDMKVHCLKPLNVTLNNYTGQYLVGVIKASLKETSYADQISSTILPEVKIKLPVNSEGNPDWEYMEEYMKNIETKVHDKVSKLEFLKGKKKKKINISQWKKYYIEELFEAYLSNDDIQPKNILSGETPLVSSGKENNGIISYICDDTAKLWDANTLTVDMFGKTFYQDKPYYCVSHGRVNILKPIEYMSEYSMKFIALAIEAVASNKYGFNEMCTGKKILKDEIYLPSKNNKPDWLYMEEYMKNIETGVCDKILKLQSIISC